LTTGVTAATAFSTPPRIFPHCFMPRKKRIFGFACDQRLDHGPAGRAHDVGDDRIKFDIGVFQGLLDPLDMAALNRPGFAGDRFC